MKKITITISFDDEKLSTLRLYLEQKGSQVESELEKYLDTLYNKNVPAGVREFFDMRSGIQKSASEKPRIKKPKSDTSAVVDDIEASSHAGN